MSADPAPTLTLVVPLRDATPGSGPLAWAQTAIWEVLRWLPPGDATLNLISVRRIGPDHDLPRVCAALSALMARHDVLHTLFAVHDGRPEQRVLAEAELDLPVHDVDRGVDEVALDDYAEDLAARLRAVPFDTERELPLRVAVVRRDGRPARIVLVLSHLAVDGGSLALLGRDLDALLADPAPDPAPAPVHQPLDRVAWEESEAGRRHAERSLEHWERGVRDLPKEWLASVRGEQAPESRWAELDSPELALAVRVLANRTGMTPGMVAQAGVAAQLGLLRGQRTVGLRLIVATRFRPETRDLVAAFNQNALLRIDLRDEPFSRYLLRSGSATLTAYTASEYGPNDLEARIAEVCAERGFAADGYCFYNDVRYAGEDGDWRAPLPEDWRHRLDQLRGSTRATDLEPLGDQKGSNFFLYVDALSGSARLTLSAERRFLPEPTGFLTDLVRLLTRAALTDTGPLG